MDILQPKFKESDIPYQSLEKIGISKMDVLSMDRQNLEALLSGKRTSLINLKGMDLKGEEFNFSAKLSLYRKEDNSVDLMIHPVRREIKNDAGLKPEELEKLKSGDLIAKQVNGEKYLIQLDKDTNELLKVKTKNINVPTHIKDIELSSQQKENMKNGQPITLESGNNNERFQVRIDLNSPKGIKFQDDLDLKKKIEFDRVNPQVIGFVQTDKNRQEYTDYYNKKNDISNDANINKGHKKDSGHKL